MNNYYFYPDTRSRCHLIDSPIDIAGVDLSCNPPKIWLTRDLWIHLWMHHLKLKFSKYTNPDESTLDIINKNYIIQIYLQAHFVS